MLWLHGCPMLCASPNTRVLAWNTMQLLHTAHTPHTMGADISKSVSALHTSFGLKMALAAETWVQDFHTLHLLKHMMCLDPCQRISAQAALKHPYFQNEPPPLPPGGNDHRLEHLCRNATALSMPAVISRLRHRLSSNITMAVTAA
jgi:serine/threonine protein kinase